MFWCSAAVCCNYKSMSTETRCVMWVLNMDVTIGGDVRNEVWCLDEMKVLKLQRLLVDLPLMSAAFVAFLTWNKEAYVFRCWTQERFRPTMSPTTCFKIQMAAFIKWCSRLANKRQPLYWRQLNRWVLPSRTESEKLFSYADLTLETMSLQAYNSRTRHPVANGHAETADGNLVIFETALWDSDWLLGHETSESAGAHSAARRHAVQLVRRPRRILLTLSCFLRAQEAWKSLL